LERELGELLGGPVSIRDRRRNWYTSTVVTELVTIGLGSSTRELFCKHGASYVDHVSGHRRGVPYESAAYTNLVGPSMAPSVAYVGTVVRPDSSTLVIERLRGALRLHDTGAGPTSAVVVAAHLLGAWHRRGEDRLARAQADLNEFDAEHFRRWKALAARALEEAPGGDGHALERIITAPEVCEALLEKRTTLVHGELFTGNVLVAPDGSAYFVDWESAGRGPGEIDLAALIVGGWPAATRELCIDAYVTARHPEGEPPHFRRSLAAAEIYVLHRIARHETHRGSNPGRWPWFDPQVEAASRRLGVSA
jgi:hypothetical protein